MNAIPEAISRASFSSPMGNLVGLASEQGLVALEFEDPGLLGSLESRFHRTFLGMKVESRDTAVHRATGAWLESYFAGGRPDSESVPLDLRGTDFERAVWGALLEVQIGTTVSYSELARRLAKDGRQGSISLRGDILLEVDKKLILVKAPAGK